MIFKLIFHVHIFNLLKVDMVFAYFQAQKTFGQEMDKASKYLLKELKNAKDPYFVSIVTYAFHLSEHSEKDVALQKLLSLSTRGGKLCLNGLFSNGKFCKLVIIFIGNVYQQNIFFRMY